MSDITAATAKVLAAFLSDPKLSRYGFDLSRATALKSGSLYPILSRLETAGWIESQWEGATDRPAAGPRRRYYALTAGGVQAARQALAEYRNAASVPGTRSSRLAWGSA